jgi:hypothetical protein
LPWRPPGQQQTIQRCNMHPLWWPFQWPSWCGGTTVCIARWRRFVAFIKATKRRHRASTHLAWCFRCNHGDFVGRCQLLHRGVTYQSDGKDLANVLEYLYWGAKLVS